MTITGYVSLNNPTQQAEAPNPALEGIAKIASVAVGVLLTPLTALTAGVFTVIRVVNLVSDFMKTGRFYDSFNLQFNLLSNDIRQVGSALYGFSTLPLNLFYFFSGVSPVYTLESGGPKTEVLEDDWEVLRLEDLPETSVDAESPASDESTPVAEDTPISEERSTEVEAAASASLSRVEERTVRVLVSPHAAPVTVSVRGDGLPTLQDVIRAQREALEDPDRMYDANPFAESIEF